MKFVKTSIGLLQKLKQSLFSKDESKEKDATSTNSNKIQAYFTIDPYKFKTPRISYDRISRNEKW